MLKINRKVWSVIEKNNINNVQVFTNINTFKSSLSVVFSSVKDYKIFIKQFDYKYGINGAKLFPDMLEVIWQW